MTERSEAADPPDPVVLNSITGLIVTIAADGTIHDANRPWNRFLANRCPECPTATPDSNYFAICRWLTESDADQYGPVERGLEALFADSPDPFECAFQATASVGRPIFVLRASLLEQGGPPLVVLVHNEVARIQQTLIRMTEARVKNALRERERQTLDRLDSYCETAVTEAIGLGPLRMTSPGEFARLTEIYKDVLELAMVHRIYKVGGSVSVRVRLLAEDLGCVDGHPRDLIEIHRRAFTEKIRGLSPARTEMLHEEGRLLLLELMGHLASYYRSAGKTELREPKPRTVRRGKEVKG